MLLTFFFGRLFLGVIETSDRLDRESTSHYWLTVYATDQGVVPLSSFIEVYIEVEDVNDNAPQTSEPVYYPEIMENSPKDVSVVQIEAFDPDSSSNDKLTYRITSGNPQGFFSIHPKTGTLCVCVCVCVSTLSQLRARSSYFSLAKVSLVWYLFFLFSSSEQGLICG